jgi:hypothetical protein
MSESRTKLEQILELLLAEDNAKAEEMLHEYVVSKARAEYERVLDESEEEVEETVDSEDEEAVEETIDQSNDFEDDILADESEIAADEAGFNEADDEEEGEEEAGEVEGDEDLEDKVDDLEAELEDLRAEFEKLMAGEEGEEHMDDAEMADMEAGDEDMMGDEGEDEMMDSVEYDLDEEAEEDSEVVEEATKLQDKVAAPKAPAADASNGTSPVAKHKAGWETGAPVKAKDGGEGNKGATNAKDHTPTSNIGIKPAKVNVPKA